MRVASVSPFGSDWLFRAKRGVLEVRGLFDLSCFLLAFEDGDSDGFCRFQLIWIVRISQFMFSTAITLSNNSQRVT